MTRHDWIVLAGVALSLVIAVTVVIYNNGRMNRHLEDVERRIQVLEEKVDSIDRRTSRIEGYLIHLTDGETALPAPAADVHLADELMPD